MLTGFQRRSSAAAWELLSCGKAAGASEQFAPLTRASAASTPLSIAVCLIALTGLLAGWLTPATHPLAATLLTLGAMTLLLRAAAEFYRGPESSHSSCKGNKEKRNGE
ncbi:MAG: hypothetical protein DMG70_25560 [Acidobacteria bacterium]|nr:MAG: hypothetical protein DMG70_25560 [Acidobacteriota bacterium]PYY09056.1 MAG: hypothetical protein DMG69_12625 [Acidobacteriota bacterium]